MKNQSDNYWYFTRTERRGVLALGLLCLCLFMAPAFFNRLRPLKTIDASDFEQAVRAFASDTTQEQVQVSLFYFNPNHLSHDSFLLLGLSARTAGAIIRYRQKGGYFKHPEDLRKIYTLAAADYERLEPYITIHTSKQVQPMATKSPYRKDTPLQLFVFDPNKIGRQELEQLGIPLWISKIWINYLNKGGRFATKEDLLKLYGMTAKLYQQLEPYIVIAPTTPRQIATKKNNNGSFNSTRLIEIHINQANQAQWEQLDGIGPALAQRITNFRDKLGGFVSIDQVAETRGLPDSVFQKVKYQLVADPVFRYISVNSADQHTLEEHPYISFQEARALINYRTQHGPFQDLRHLARIKIWKSDRLEKVLPYMKLE